MQWLQAHLLPPLLLQRLRLLLLLLRRQLLLQQCRQSKSWSVLCCAVFARLGQRLPVRSPLQVRLEEAPTQPALFAPTTQRHRELLQLLPTAGTPVQLLRQMLQTAQLPPKQRLLQLRLHLHQALALSSFLQLAAAAQKLDAALLSLP